jgi:5-methylcytosine-specific restriction protein A
MKRRTITPAKQVRIFDANGGCCHICELKIQVGEPWDVEHIKPLWLGGADDESNMKPAHRWCHQGKTSAEAPVRAKSNRVRARHLGIARKPTKFRGWRKMDGTVVYANDRRK